VSAIKLRPYQEAALEGARVALRGGARSTLLQLPTGTGKSIIFQRIIEGVTSKAKRALLLVQGQNLVRQAAKHLGQLGVSVGVEMGDDRVGPRIGARGLIDDAPQIIVASRDSLARRLKHYPPDFFRVIVADEAHHALSAQWLHILAHFGVSVPTTDKKGKIIPGSKTAWGGNTILIGLTATPDRGDHGDIMAVFEAAGFKYNILQAIDDGWLVPIKQELCHLDGLDLSKVRTSVGDLNASDLEAVIRPLLEPICKEIVKVADGRPTLIYNPLVTMAAATTAHLTQKTKGAGRVVTVTAETEEREALFKEMARGNVWAFSSVGTLTEGVDIPCATIGAMLRMTKSRPLYAQIMGRILRPAESLAHALNDMSSAAERRAAIRASSKPDATMLDFAGNSGRHKLIGVVDVIGEDEDDKTMSLAKGHTLRGVTDPHEAIRKAKEELAEMLRKAAGSEIERIIVDPFALFSVKAKADAQSRPPTEAQVEALLNAGAVECKINSASSRDKARKVIAQRFDLLTAQAMLDESRRRVTARQASLRQVRRLVKANLPLERARTISFQDARTAIDELEAQGWETSPAWIAKHSGAAAGATT
jgi:superfamily II DNA or RNA helicase